MTKGVVIFAQNNKEIDYVELAIYAAQQVKTYLSLPVTIITDSKNWLEKAHSDKSSIFDSIIEVKDNSHQSKKFYDGISYKTDSWKNFTRFNVFHLSPYDETLVIDSDYIINSNFLKFCWDQPQDFLIYDKNFDIAGWRDTSEFEFISEYSIKFYWATVFFFRKNKLNECFFNLIEHIKSNWIYYVKLYRLTSTKFRNDYAFSIAIHMMNGFIDDSFATPIPNKLSYVLDRDILIEHKNNKMKFLIQKQNKGDDFIAVSTRDLDVHVMNKHSLLRIIRNV